jgi:hypothetical protein
MIALILAAISENAVAQSIASHLPLPRAPTRRNGWVIRYGSYTVCTPAWPFGHFDPGLRMASEAWASRSPTLIHAWCSGGTGCRRASNTPPFTQRSPQRMALLAVL